MSIMECNEETIEVLHNSRYGGYELSDKAKNGCLFHNCN